ncbi:hypothetical protein [Larkinella soli]|uniref:hypothetical protein n=1 Tax=Larkinella soli TaxID=1770527 RepID=UPI000FFB4B06|nr:hypothetical protein [Larkinella soli]
MRTTEIILPAVRRACLALGLFLSVQLRADHPAGGVAPMKTGAVKLQSAGVMAFSPDGILFLADPKAGSIYALDVKDREKTTLKEVEITGIDKKIGAMLGIAADQVVIADMAVHPVSGNIFLSVSRGRGNEASPILLKVSPKGDLEEVGLGRVGFYQTNLSAYPSAETKTKWGEPVRTYAITDLAFTDGELLVSGINGEEFSSKLRRIAYPFRNEEKITSVEVFHTSHNQYETNSPIDTFLPYQLNGEPILLAGYGCAPFAKFSMKDIRAGKHVRGATLAELGGGSRPLDMVPYSRNGKNFIMVANSHRTLMRFSADDIAGAPSLTQGVTEAYVSAGIPYVSIAVVGVLHLDNLNDTHFVAVQRSIEDGSLNLVSLSKKWM